MSDQFTPIVPVVAAPAGEGAGSPRWSSGEAGASTPAATAITLKIPKLNMQFVVLLLLAVVTVFQTAQLWSLKGKASSISVKPASAASGASAPAAGAGSGLQGMVGGC